jgi:hypothetical protein
MHHRPNSAMDPSLVQATLHLNRSLSQYAMNQTKEAFENMQEAYKLRSKAIGKNSIEASYCLEALSRWSFTSKSW